MGNKQNVKIQSFNISRKAAENIVAALIMLNVSFKCERGVAGWAVQTIDYEDVPLDFSYMSLRLQNILRDAGINTIADVRQYSARDLRKLKNMGSKSMNELKSILAYEGFRMKL